MGRLLYQFSPPFTSRADQHDSVRLDIDRDRVHRAVVVRLLSAATPCEAQGTTIPP